MRSEEHAIGAYSQGIIVTQRFAALEVAIAQGRYESNVPSNDKEGGRTGESPIKLAVIVFFTIVAGKFTCPSSISPEAELRIADHQFNSLALMKHNSHAEDHQSFSAHFDGFLLPHFPERSTPFCPNDVGKAQM
jgi:hypothetical protein